MREIKFRAWSKRGAGMSSCADFAEWIRQYQLTPHFQPHEHFDPKNAVVMQFTGLKDKNGKEIYEGDVVTWQGVNDVRGEAYFERGRFLVRNHYVTHYDDPSDAFGEGAKTLEVIGNIYENPELLTSK